MWRGTEKQTHIYIDGRGQYTFRLGYASREMQLAPGCYAIQALGLDLPQYHNVVTLVSQEENDV